MDPRSALSDVPLEVFCKILALASAGQFLKTAQVLWAINIICSQWRSVALSDPTLGRRTCEKGICQDLKGNIIAALREHLTWSQSVPLYINVSVPSTAPPTTPCLILFIGLLLSQSHRFKRLSIDIPVPLITPDYNNLDVSRISRHIPPSFAFALSLPAVKACHFLIEGTSTPPRSASKPEENLENLRELVLESLNPIYARDLQVPVSALPTTLASLTIRNLALSVAVIRHLPETEEMYIVKEPKVYMAYLPEDVVVVLINTIEHRLDHGLLRYVRVQPGFIAPKLDRSLWRRIEVLNSRDNVAVKFISLWR
ncbi:hypothetical protein IW262DRAFT_1508180 [Armillaria fumosa]|nr:hypothetical protein IW262DRAFT_1508180 [Armillaria fumosa]